MKKAIVAALVTGMMMVAVSALAGGAINLPATGQTIVRGQVRC